MSADWVEGSVPVYSRDICRGNRNLTRIDASMKSNHAWYCVNGHSWLHEAMNATEADAKECPTCDTTDVSGPFWDIAQAEFVYLKRLDNKRLGK